MNRELRLRNLEDARALSVEGDYDNALETVQSLLRELPDDVEVLRLYGNILEQKALHLAEVQQTRLVGVPDYHLARQLYERILRLDPGNLLALIDLGDHYKNLDAYDRAFSFYHDAVALIRSYGRPHGRSEVLEELLSTSQDLGRQVETAERARHLALECEHLLR
jgi:tetratricopeptide (TPR) repeat protein